MTSSAGQLELAILRAQLDTFERQFYRTVGPCYVALDDARAQAAGLRARFMPSAHGESQAARARARASAEECATALHRSAGDLERLRRLHHDLARAFHPDLVTDPERAVLREQLMTEANLGYHEGNLGRLEVLERALDRDENGDAARQFAELASSPIAQLREQAEYAARHDRDLLAELVGYLRKLAIEAQDWGARLPPSTSRPTNLTARALEDLVLISASRRLFFPPDRSMGELLVRAERDIDAPLSVAGQARGIVRIPFGKAVILRLGKTCGDLSPLERLDPEDLHGLIDEWPDFVNLNDDRVRPLAHFRSLEEIRLGRTEITGRVFEDFRTLHQLRVLILEETQFDDAGLLRLEECVWMQRLDLSFTQVTGPGLWAIHNMTALRDLSLYGAAVADRDLAVLERIPGLRNLNLGLTGVTDRCAAHLRHLHALAVLNLGGTNVTDAILEALAQLPALRDLVLWETTVTAGAMEKLKTFPALRYLDVDQTGVTQEALADFRAERPEVRLPSDIWPESAGA